MLFKVFGEDKKGITMTSLGNLFDGDRTEMMEEMIE